MKRSAILIALPIALLVVSLLPCQTSAGITFTKVADTSTLIPDGSGSFASLGSASIDNGRVVFVGSGASGQTGIYEYYDGQLSMRVNQNTPIPGGTGGFTKFDIPSLDGADIAFRAEGASKQAGVYMQYDGSLVKIADKNTQIPGTTSNFGFSTGYSLFNIGEVTLSDRVASFKSDTGIYLGTPDSVIPIATRPPAASTPIPDQPFNFNIFALDFSPVYRDGQLVLAARYVDFNTDFLTDGVYRWSDSKGLETIVDQNSIFPGESSPLSHFLAAPFIDVDGVAYLNVIEANGLSYMQLTLGSLEWKGLFRIDPDGLTHVVTREDLDGSLGPIGALLWFTIDDGRIVFPGIDEKWIAYQSGEQQIIVSAGDILDGKTVDELDLSNNKSRRFLSGNQVALTLKFTDGSSGLYLATIPEPSTLAMAATALVGLGMMVRRRRAVRAR